MVAMCHFRSRKKKIKKGNLILLPNSEIDRQSHGRKGWEQLGAAFLILWELAVVFW